MTFESFTPTRLSVVIIFWVMIVYSNSFQGPFIFDDLNSIRDNKTIQDLQGSLLETPQHGETTSGRPFLNFTFAINFFLGRESVWGYHLVNLLIHIFMSVTMFHFLHHLLKEGSFAQVSKEKALGVAFWAALLWSLHPLQTSSVTYLSQRAESLGSLFYLLCLFTFIQGERVGSLFLGRFLSVLFCFLGVATKEMVFTAPFVILMYDYLFISKSLKKVFYGKCWYYGGLWSALLFYLVYGSFDRGETTGFGGSMASIDYFVTQVWAVTHYFRLLFWPHPLVFDYGTILILSPGKLSLAVGVLGVMTWLCIFVSRDQPKALFWLAFSFFILIPSSSFFPIETQTIAEHRFYFASFVWILLGVIYLNRYLKQKTIWIYTVLAFVFSALTFHRNKDYASSLKIWERTALDFPLNDRANHNYAVHLASEGRNQEAETYYLKTIEMSPFHSQAYYNLAVLYEKQMKTREAIFYHKKNLSFFSQDIRSLINLGNLYWKANQLDLAEFYYRRVIEVCGKEWIGYQNLVSLLIFSQRPSEALVVAQQAFAQYPEDSDSYALLAKAYESLGLLQEAETALLKVLEYDPHHRSLIDDLERINRKMLKGK